MRNANCGKSRDIRLSMVAVIVLLMALIPAASFASSISGDSRTYLRVIETGTDKTLIPLYEYLDLSVQQIGTEEVTFHFGGWLRQDLADESFNKRRFNSDLQYAYFSYKRKSDNLILNIGRVFVSEGVALEPIDGIYAASDLAAGFGISAYGGIPVETDFDERNSDSIYGGRLSHELPGIYRIGASYLKEDNDGKDFREEAGFDIWLYPVKKVQLMGWSNYNSITSDWMDHSYYLTLGPVYRITLNGEVSWISYKDYFTSINTSALQLQPGGYLNPDEKVLATGGSASVDLTETVTFSVLYKNFDYDIAGSAQLAGWRITAVPNDELNFGASWERMNGDTDRLKYSQIRVYAQKKLGKTDLVLDIINTSYKEKISGKDNAFVMTIGAGYELTETSSIAADFDYSKNPDYDEQGKLFLKYLYRFGT